MAYTLEELSEENRIAVIDIFNYYLENSFAAYPGEILPAKPSTNYR